MSVIVTAAVALFIPMAIWFLQMGYAHPENYSRNLYPKLMSLGGKCLMYVIAFYFGMMAGAGSMKPYLGKGFADKIAYTYDTFLIGALFAGLWIIGAMAIASVAAMLRVWGISKGPRDDDLKK